MLKGYIRAILLWLLVFGVSWANSYFIFETSTDKARLERKIDKISGDILLSPELRELMDKLNVKLSVQEVGEQGEFILRTNTLPSSELTALFYQKLKESYPKLYFIERGSSAKNVEHTKVITVKEPVYVDSGSEDYTIWIALFGLAIIGVFALALSSFQIKDLMKRHKEIQKKHEEMERKISEMFSMMGENIHKLSKDIVQYTSDIMEEADSTPIKTKLRHVVNAESRVLDSASNLLDFLYLKAKKVEVKKEHFNINNALNDMLENLVKNVSRSDLELIFDIDKSMPKFIIGDFIHIGEVFGKLLEHIVVVSNSEEVIVQFSSSSNYSGDLELQVKLIYNSSSDIEDCDSYFIPVYDENQGEYKRLGLYVAQELVKLMNGDISVNFNQKSEQFRISVTIPVEESPDEDRRKYHLPSKDYIQRNILIVNRSYEASLALKKLFTYFKHKVKTLPSEKLNRDDFSLEDFDIVMIDEYLVDRYIVEKASEAKEQNDSFKLVALKNIFDTKFKSHFADRFDLLAKKPITQQNALLLLQDLYSKSSKISFSYLEIEPTPRAAKNLSSDDEFKESQEIVESEEIKKTIEPERPRREFQSNIVPTPNIGINSFKEFSKYTIMVVEDNFINMKMLLRVLSESRMKILTAQNGLEAVDKVKKLRDGELDLILMDINMPVMDGYSATKQIRELEIGRELPIVALSALSLENEFRRMQEAQMDGYIPKPLDIGKLYTVFTIFLSKDFDKSKTATKEEHKLEIDGIDVDVALEHVNNNILLLREVLYEFISLYGESDKEIEKLYRDRRFEQLKQYLFDLVGLTNTIGAKDLAIYAKEMRKLYIYNKLDILPAYLKDYSEALTVIKNSLRSYLNN